MTDDYPELIEECEVCDEPLNANEAGHYKSPDERFWCADCYPYRGAHDDGLTRKVDPGRWGESA